MKFRVKKIFSAKNSVNKLILVFILSNFFWGYSQDEVNKIVVPDSLLVKFETRQEVDTLSKKKYDQLIEIIYSEDFSFEIKKKCADIFFDKAKKENLSSRIAQAYSNLRYLVYINDDPIEIEISYLDSVINYTKDKRIFGYPTFPYYIKGLRLLDKKDFKNSLENFLEAHKYAEEDNDLYQLYDVKYSIALLKSRIGDYKEALEIFKECYEYEKLNNGRPQSQENLIVILSALSDEYRRNGKIDSSSTINRIGLKKASSINFEDYRGFFLLSEGINHYLRCDYSKSIENIKESIKILKRTNDQSNLAFANFYLGKNHEKLLHFDKAILFFKTVDTIFQRTQDLHPDLREGYERLVDYYKANNDKDNQLYYTERLIKLDSVLNDNFKYLSPKIIKEYDTPKLLSKKEEIISELESEKSFSKRIILFLAVLVLIVISALIFYYKKQKTYKKRFEELLKADTLKEEKITSLKEESNIGISDEITQNILEQLNGFEEKKCYLKPNITTTNLAEKFNTNSKYISKIVNTHKKKSFIKYINDLRVNYAVDRLKLDTIFRKYTIKAIANEVGFNSAESFSSAFVKKTGISPSYFLKELEKKTEDCL